MATPGRSAHEETIFGVSTTAMVKNQYKISKTKILGQGSFATVYKGLDTKGCKGVAVKVYHNTSDLNRDQFIKSIKVLLTLHNLDKVGTDSRCLSQYRGSAVSPAVSLNPVSPTLSVALSRYGSMTTVSDTVSFKPDILTNGVKSLWEESPDREDPFTNGVKDLHFSDCFVELLNYSADEQGEPGLDPVLDLYYLIFELGDESLSEALEDKRNHKKMLSKEELRSLHWSLVTIVCGLHKAGFVHLDIKPYNIVRFSRKAGRTTMKAKGANTNSRWKLIDLDGAAKTREVAKIEEVVCTPQYMPPEVARAVLAYRANRQKGTVILSRLMDVWSVGMCALEAIFLTPVLSVWYDEWMEDTLSDDKFLKWLADDEAEAIVSGPMEEAMKDVDPDMCDFLKKMLARDEKRRSCITEMFEHKWLTPVREVVAEELEEYASQLSGKTRRSLLAEFSRGLNSRACCTM